MNAKDWKAMALAAMLGHGRECADHCVHPDHRVEPAKLVKDREYGNAWRVEWCDDDGGCEITVFAGPKAYDRANSYAELQYGLYQS